LAWTIALAQPGRAAPGGAALDAGAGGLAEDVEIVLALVCRRPVSLAALLGLQDEAVPLVAIDPAKALRAIAIVLEHAAFEHVIVVRIVGAAAGGRIDAKNAAQAVDEALRIGEFRPARIAPVGDEFLDFGRFPHHRDHCQGKAQRS
jgi:hypothetical protein